MLNGLKIIEANVSKGCSRSTECEREGEIKSSLKSYLQ